MYLRNAIKIYIASATTLIALIGALLIFAESKHDAAVQQFEQHMGTELIAKDLLQALTDRETGQRGFLLTLDPQFIEPYVEAGLRINGLVEQLRPVMDSGDWNELKQLIAQRADYFKTTFALVGGLPQQQQEQQEQQEQQQEQEQQQQQQQQAIELVRSGDGKKFMDTMRHLLGQTNDRFQKASADAAATYDDISAWTTSLIYISTILLLILLIRPVFYIHRSVFKPLLDLGDALQQMGTEREPIKVSTIDSAPEISTMIEQVTEATSELIDYESELNNSITELNAVRAQQDKIFAIVGHELRTPASAIKMLLNEEKLINKESHNLVEADQHATHLLNILDDMRLAATDGALLEVQSEEAKQVKVFQTLKSCIIALQPLADKHRFTIDLNGSVANPLGHTGNPKVVQQIVQNLIKNAVLHSKGSMINISMDYEHLEANKTHFTVEVRDNGTGIPVEFQARMFKAFERGDTVSDGTGLGLNVAYELAGILEDGKLFYRDNPEGGAIFTLGFTFDKVIEKPKNHKLKHESIEGLKILLAEDTPTLRLLGKNIIERAGAKVEVAVDGEEALALLTDFDPDLVLTDIMMPNMNGYELTEALRKRGFTKPIIGVTGATVGMEAKRLIESGANTVLAKPLTVLGLETALKSINEDDAESLGSA